jgi:hypothetical protein
VTVHIIPCIEGRVEHASPFAQASRYGSILPATWSLMLALRARGLGTAWTTLHLRYQREVGQWPGIAEQTTQAALLPVASFTGTDFKPGKRLPARERTYGDPWGQTREGAGVRRLGIEGVTTTRVSTWLASLPTKVAVMWEGPIGHDPDSPVRLDHPHKIARWGRS